MLLGLLIGDGSFDAIFRQKYKLLMVGQGELDDVVNDAIQEKALTAGVKRIQSVEYKNMWKLYRVADCSINLNKAEIFGMLIMEAMYYECPIIAWDAPGPSFITDKGRFGCIVNLDEEIIGEIINNKCL